ncbi:uncharacterized protein K02A2.6-like [Haliotis rubra]|uniref:uncharacterized protein K02A2.6-like n=1 Tax=Haliotis rubra TaxID=36100 RepID=UPI001EE5B8AC|nr:uncharacterized protein K02A2.6-like [Haliotis rubra]
MGQFTATVCHKNTQIDLMFVVTTEDVQSIVGLKACDQLHLVRRVLSVGSELPLDGDVVFQNYADVFQGLGDLTGVHHIKLDNDVPPVVHACRRVPFALHDRLKEELNRMEKLDVITKVNEPTDWWLPQQEHTWLSLKQVVSQEPVLKFFDPGRKIKISSDASQNELDGVIFKGVRVVIPTSLRKYMLDKINAGHLGMEKCKRRSRETVFWPRLNHDIDDIVSNCSMCQTYRNRKVAADLFYCGGKDYLVIVDYLSNYPEVCSLTDTSSRRVITAMKTVFARHGIPDEVFTDNGPQFRSHEFRQFAHDWQFKHNTSSPNYPQSNGLAEKAVQIVKNILLKENQDPYMGSLAYRSSPLDCGQSPAEILMGRRIRANLPIQEKLLQVSRSRKVVKFKENQKLKQKHYYDRSTKPLSRLQCGDRVAVRDHRRCDWSQRGTVVQDAGQDLTMFRQIVVVNFDRIVVIFCCHHAHLDQ